MENETMMTVDKVESREAEVATEERLAAIAAALAARLSEAGGAPAAASEMPVACPIDPAERAACDSCQ